jgi:hypothetical protein
MLTNKTPIYVMIKVVLQTPEQVERGNLPTFPDVTSCLTGVLEEVPNTLATRMVFNAL